MSVDKVDKETVKRVGKERGWGQNETIVKEVGLVLSDEANVGLIKRYGVEGQMIALTPQATVFLDNLDGIRATTEYREVLKRFGVADGSIEEAGVIGGLLGLVGLVEARREGLIEGEVRVTEENVLFVALANQLSKGMHGEPGGGVEGTAMRGVLRQMGWELESFAYGGRIIEAREVFTTDLRDIEKRLLGEMDEEEGTRLLKEISGSEGNRGFVAAIREYWKAMRAKVGAKGKGRSEIAGRQKKNGLDRVVERELCREGETFGERVKAEDIPEIVILRGVGQTEDKWRERMAFYEERGIRCRFVDWDRFESFEQQADDLYGALMEGQEEGRKFCFEAHSWGGISAGPFSG